MTLEEAIEKFPESNVKLEDFKNLPDQESTFQYVLDVLKNVTQTGDLIASSTYGLKHVFENPFSNLFKVNSIEHDTYMGYVYEGTIVLALNVLGFEYYTPCSTGGGFVKLNTKSLHAAFLGYLLYHYNEITYKNLTQYPFSKPIQKGSKGRRSTKGRCGCDVCGCFIGYVTKFIDVLDYTGENKLRVCQTCASGKNCGTVFKD